MFCRLWKLQDGECLFLKHFSHLCKTKHYISRNSLDVQWLGLWAFISKGQGLSPGWGTKILQAKPHGEATKKKQKQHAINSIIELIWNTVLNPTHLDILFFRENISIGDWIVTVL